MVFCEDLGLGGQGKGRGGNVQEEAVVFFYR